MSELEKCQDSNCMFFKNGVGCGAPNWREEKRDNDAVLARGGHLSPSGNTEIDIALRLSMGYFLFLKVCCTFPELIQNLKTGPAQP